MILLLYSLQSDRSLPHFHFLPTALADIQHDTLGSLLRPLHPTPIFSCTCYQAAPALKSTVPSSVPSSSQLPAHIVSPTSQTWLSILLPSTAVPHLPALALFMQLPCFQETGGLCVPSLSPPTNQSPKVAPRMILPLLIPRPINLRLGFPSQ